LIRRGIVLFGVATAVAALWTGWKLHFAIGSMTGFFPPHYGYSAYVESAALILGGSSPLALVCALALALSDNRDALLGVLAGYAYLAAGWRRRAACGILGGLAVVVGAWVKPHTYNDSVRVQAWIMALKLAKEVPGGIGTGNFAIWFNGKWLTKAHSDVLQLLVEQGIWVWVGVMSLAVWGHYAALKGPATRAKATLLCLTVQSIFDNRLHRPVCIGLYALICILVFVEQRFNTHTL